MNELRVTTILPTIIIAQCHTLCMHANLVPAPYVASYSILHAEKSSGHVAIHVCVHAC